MKVKACRSSQPSSDSVRRACSVVRHAVSFQPTIRPSTFTQHSPLSCLVCQAMAIINGSLYVFGGTTGYIYSTDLHKLDLNAREWTQLKPNNMHCDMPEERWVSWARTALFGRIPLPVPADGCKGPLLRMRERPAGSVHGPVSRLHSGQPVALGKATLTGSDGNSLPLLLSHPFTFC